LTPRRWPFLGRLNPEYGIDLGTSTSRVYAPGLGIVAHEPSVVAVEQLTGRVWHGGAAVGSLARILQGRTPDAVHTVRPLRHGVVADLDYCEALLRCLIERAGPRGWGRRPRLLVAIPGRITGVERQAVLCSARRAGARQTMLMHRAHAAALGAGLPVSESSASMICDLGSGTTELAVLCLGSITVSESIPVGGDAIDFAIQEFLRRRHKLRVGAQTAERIKIEIGSAGPLETETSCEVRGGDVLSGLPRKLSIGSSEVREALADPLRAILDAAQRTLEQCNPELAADLVDNGMVLSGGGALLRGLDKRLTEVTGMPVRVAEDAMNCVVRGIGACLDHPHLRQRVVDVRTAA
jgi:rod shape-determining protein MreB